jgi:hypothetical protein
LVSNGAAPSIAIGSSDRIHIIYNTNNNLQYTSTVIPYPVGQQSFTYNSVTFPVLHIDPAEAKPIGVISRDRLIVRVSLEQFEGGVDIYGAYTVSTDPEHVYLLNPDGSSFAKFTVSEINNALSIRGTPPSGAEPWRSLILFPFDETIVNVPVSSLPGIYTVYLLVTKTDFIFPVVSTIESLSDHYLWSTSFVIP